MTTETIVLDSHMDTPSRILYEGFSLAGDPDRSGHVDIPRLRRGGVDAAIFAIFIDPVFASAAGPGSEPRRPSAANEAFRMIDAVEREVARHPQELMMARSVHDVRGTKRGDRIAILLGLEGGHAIEGSLPLLRTFRRLGVCYLTLTHVNTNDWCDSSGDAARWNGLNDLGREVIREMNRIGMLIDVSHISDAAFDAVLETSVAPVAASHSSCRALCHHPRNLSDAMMRRLAEQGGVVMINVHLAFLSTEYASRCRRLEVEHQADLAALGDRWRHDPWARWNVRNRFLNSLIPVSVRPGIDVVADHVIHAMQVAGSDHVGLGSDFDGIPLAPVGFEDCSRVPALVDRLRERGVPEADISKFLGENFLTVLTAVESVAQDSVVEGR